MTSETPNLHVSKKLNISKTKQDIEKLKTPLRLVWKCCSDAFQIGSTIFCRRGTLKRNDHPLLCHLTEGYTIVAKCYLGKVCKAVLQKGCELISIARKVIQIIGQLVITCSIVKKIQIYIIF